MTEEQAQQEVARVGHRSGSCYAEFGLDATNPLDSPIYFLMRSKVFHY